MRKNGVTEGHTGRTRLGPTRDVKADRIGRVTIYKRGRSYYSYYRENGKSLRQCVEGNLNTARQAASSVNHALEESRHSPRKHKSFAEAEPSPLSSQVRARATGS